MDDLPIISFRPSKATDAANITGQAIHIKELILKHFQDESVVVCGEIHPENLAVLRTKGYNCQMSLNECGGVGYKISWRSKGFVEKVWGVFLVDDSPDPEYSIAHLCRTYGMYTSYDEAYASIETIVNRSSSEIFIHEFVVNKPVDMQIGAMEEIGLPCRLSNAV